MPANSSGMHSYNTLIFYATYGTASPGGKLTDAGGGGWSNLAEVYSFNGVPLEDNVTKLTNLNSPEKAHEKIPGFTDAGQATLSLNYFEELLFILQQLKPDETDTAPAWGRFQWLIQFPDGGQWYCTAFLKSIPTTAPEDDRVTIEVTLEISGRPSFSTN